MPNFALVVTSNAKPGREDEYNDWYDNTHLGEVAGVPGFLNGQRFEPSTEPADGPLRYLAVYEMETEDPDASMAALQEAIADGKVQMTDAIDGETIDFQIYRIRTGKVVA